jgi:hypothetical protein
MTAARRRTAIVIVLRLAGALIAYAVFAVIYRFGLGFTGAPNLLAVLVATAAVAILLHVADEPIGQLSDHLAYGSQAESQRRVRGLLRRMANTLPVDEVIPRLAQTATRTVGGPRAAVTLTMADGQEWTQVWPPDAGTGASVVSAGVHHQGVAIGAIEVELPAADIGAAQRRVLDELAAPAGLALSTVRLTVDLRRHVAELERANAALLASRDRLRSARHDERRRLRSEVDHHVVRHLTDAEHALGAVPAPTDARGVAAGHCEQALDELRLIARGIYPSRLGEAGLLVSLDGWLERARTYADITSNGELRALRDNPELEACVYFCAVTALDALATAGASALAAVIAEHDAVVTLDVSGTGGAEPAQDALTALQDRIEAFDGELTTTPTAILFRAPLSSTHVVETIR